MTEPIPELGGAYWGELEVLRHDNGRLMFPAELKRRDEKGRVTVKKCRVCVALPRDNIEARVKARAIMAEKKLDAKLDQDMFEELEQLCLLERMIRTHEAPHPQLMPYEELIDYDEPSLRLIRERINWFKVLLEPEPEELDEEQTWRTILAVARGASIDPLVDTSQRAVPGLLVRMAKEASRSPAAQPWLRSSESSTPERSPSES